MIDIELATYDNETILLNVAMALTIFASNTGELVLVTLNSIIGSHKEMLQYIGWPLIKRLANFSSVQKIAITLIGYLALNGSYSF